MESPITAFIIGVISSILAGLGAYVARKYFSSRKDVDVILKNNDGETREFKISNTNIDAEIKSSLTDAIQYENAVDHVISSIQPNYRYIKMKHQEGYDFIVDGLDKRLFIDVKVNKKPLDFNQFIALANTAKIENDDIAVISKSGFSEKIYDYLEKSKKNNDNQKISLITATNHLEIAEKLKHAINNINITNRSTRTR